MHMLLGDMILLLASPSREVVKAAIGFIKVSIAALPAALELHLSELIGGLLKWSNEHNQHFKVRVRHLMERLIRLFGYGWSS